MKKFNFFRINSFEDIGTKKFDEFIKEMFPNKEKDDESMEVKVACEEALKSVDEFQRIIDKVTESNNKKEQIELINDILDAREARKPKEVVDRTFMSQDVFDALKKRIRKEISEKHRDEIWDLINYQTNNHVQTNKAVDRIMEIIKGE